VDYSAVRLPECLRCLMVVRSICHFAYYALALSVTSPGSFLFWLVDSARRMGEPRTPLAVNDHCRSGGHRQYRPSAEMQRVGSDTLPRALRWPDRSWCEYQAFLVGPRAQVNLCCINSQEDRLFRIDRAIRRRSFTLQRQTTSHLHRLSAALC
jgi:hypothetical protein